jgi:aspartate kinase
MQVLKFGGSSLADANAIRLVAQIIREHDRIDDTVVVCSACAGITNRLVRITELVRAGHSGQALNEASAIRTHHRELLESLKSGIGTEPLIGEFAGSVHIWAELEDLGACLRATVAGASASQANAAWAASVLSFGERFSARLVAYAVRQIKVRGQFLDATNFVVTEGNCDNAAPLWPETRRRTRQVILPLLAKGIVPVITGFIGATLAGQITTLGRNSSDFSAAIVGASLDADEVCLWTDVDGVYTGDPRSGQQLAADFTFLDNLSYDEALHLAERGAKVVHPRTIQPLKEKNIILRIRNTFRREHIGTRIGPALQTVAQ